MEDFLYDLYNVCYELVPFFGILVLIVLFVALIKLIIFLSKANKTLDKLNPNLELVEKTLEKVQVPVDSIVKVTQTVDKACETGAKVLGETKQYVTKSVTVLKDKVDSLIKEEEKDEVKSKNENVVEEGE